jgi:hypothetical protein
LTGVTLFGDFAVGYFRGMVLDAAGAVVDGSDKSLGYLSTVTSVEQGQDGYLYVTTYGGPYDSVPDSELNSLWRTVPSE